jgi:alkyldihydroxyacetonephosphate synthase
MLAWLEHRIGSPSPFPQLDPTRVSVPASRPLPDLAGASRDQADRFAHARGQGLTDLIRVRTGTIPAVPDAVVRPVDEADLEEILHVCAAKGVRVIPYGGGTSVLGGVNVTPSEAPAVSLDLEHLRGLTALDETSGLATFGAGSLGPEIEAALEPHGYTLGHFPQSWELSSLGGWIATRASGQESLGYGSIQDLVAGVEVVAPVGRLQLAAMPASAAGPDLRQLVLGSEGRLGVITRATVRVRHRPAHIEITALLFPTWQAGLDASRHLAQERVPLTLLRLSDEPETEVAMTVGLAHHPRMAPLVERWLAFRGIKGTGCLMLVGAAGPKRSVRRALTATRSLARRFGGVSLGTSPGRQWLRDRFRHPYLRDTLLDLGIATDTLETAAPWARLPELTNAVRQALESALEPDNERVAVLCHVSHPYGDGSSLYFTFFFRCPSDAQAAIARWAMVKRAATVAIVRGGGTLSHHHGVGSWHAPWFETEVGADGLRLLQAMARTLDPAQVLNPHVLLDPTDRLEI